MTTGIAKLAKLGVLPRLTFGLLAVACLTACSTPGAKSGSMSNREPAAVMSANADAHNELGIQVQALRLSAGGFMVDLRYRVVDPDRARLLLDKKVPAYLIDEASGAKFGVPTAAKLGKLRQGTQTNIQTNRDYGMLFGNPGRFMKPGARVTLVAGDSRMAGLMLQ
jgi:hypothetical protein